MRAFDTLFRFVVRLIPDKDDPKGHPGLHINLWLKRRNLAMHRKRTSYMLRRRQRRDIHDKYGRRRWRARRMLIILFGVRVPTSEARLLPTLRMDDAPRTWPRETLPVPDVS